MVDRDVIETIRERVDIVEVVRQVVTLRRRGNSWVGLCPFHQEKTPSFHVVPAKGIFHCFGCGEGGDVFKFVQKTRGLEFFEALKELAAVAGVTLPERELTPEQRRERRRRATLGEVVELACRFYQNVLLARPEGAPARAYLAERGMRPETIERYRLGFAPPGWTALLDHLHRQGVSPEMAVAAGLARERDDGRRRYDLFRNRIMVPIEDARGRVVAFGGRILPGPDVDDRTPKYVNSPESPIYRKSKVLYGLPHARPAVQRTGRLLVVEGYFDVLSLHQAGFREAVATCGTALTADHVRVIRPLTDTVVALFDSDEAGLRAAERSLALFLEAGIEPRRLDIGEAKDPDDLVREGGPEALEAALQRSEPLFDLVLRRVIDRHGPTPGGRAAALGEVGPLLRHFQGAARAAAIARVAGMLGVPEEVVAEQARGVAPRPATPEPRRWVGSKQLNHLLWLLVHFPEETAPLLAATPPELVTDRLSVRRAIAMLLKGEELPAVIDAVDDPDLAHLLRVVAAREGLYEADRAAAAMRQILDRFELNRIKGELIQLDRELATCASGDDGSRYYSLLQRRQALQRAKDDIQRRMGRNAP